MCLSTRPTSKWHFVPVPKLPKLGIPRLWSPITFREDLWLRWGLKQSCSPRYEIFNDMLHATFTQGNRVDSWLLMVWNQTANLTPGHSFGHNLYFRCPNGSCEPILDIYVLITFQWYKKLFNPLNFDHCNRSLNIQESTETPTPLEMWEFIPSHTLALSGACGMIPGFPSWPTTLQTLASVASPRLRLRHI
jgi:hypothetical protein